MTMGGTATSAARQLAHETADNTEENRLYDIMRTQTGGDRIGDPESRDVATRRRMRGEWAQEWAMHFKSWRSHYKMGRHWEAGGWFAGLVELAGTYEPSEESDAPTPRQVGLVYDTIRSFPQAEFKRLSDNPLEVQYDLQLPPVATERELADAFEACRCDDLLDRWPVTLTTRMFVVENGQIRTQESQEEAEWSGDQSGTLSISGDGSGRLVVVELKASPGPYREYEV